MRVPVVLSWQSSHTRGVAAAVVAAALAQVLGVLGLVGDEAAGLVDDHLDAGPAEGQGHRLRARAALGRVALEADAAGAGLEVVQITTVDGVASTLDRVSTTFRAAAVLAHGT